MTPPTVEVGGKGTGQDINVAFPTASTTDQPHKTNNNKKYKYFAGVVVISVVIIAAVVLGSIALHHHLKSKQTGFNIEPRYGGDLKVPEHVKIDYDRKLIIINSTQQGHIVASNILHDFQKKIIAYRDETHKMCFLDKTTYSFDDYVSRLAEIDSTTKTSVVHRKQSNYSVEPDVLRKFIGENIADHCEGDPTYWLVEDDAVCQSGELCRIKRQFSAGVSVNFGNAGWQVHVGLRKLPVVVHT
ncbi:hypothetical protein LOTGIDRAFT_238747 [Lottia gigantea]|uniref:Integral membrane protein 2 n=1 Tax=Lottia gigantea TaxID=225164 RepID=V4A6V2_LOTGI|nr:hypothetical protein LOTGIDRAFT_238747 [Lottia gigantea]ESO99663.1 hypothetical protein LOTGIDRAFT_238747 [Lottia gigantea]